MTSVALHTADPTLLPTVQMDAAQYNLPITTETEHYDYLLNYELCVEPPGYLCKLIKTGAEAPGPVSIDFSSGKKAHRRQFGGGRNQPLARACGLKAGINPCILDATAGLAGDAFALAGLGAELILCERNPAIYLLLKNALSRAESEPETAVITNHMQLYFGNTAEKLAQLIDQHQPDVIYLDPMYPQRNKTALVKKEMQFFHDIAGRDEDADKLLQTAINSGVKRVVVKRPKGAEPLNEVKPQVEVSSKNTRYDIYIN